MSPIDSNSRDDELDPLMIFSVGALEAELKGDNVDFPQRALKAELQARWVLHRLGHLNATKESIRTELWIIISWCETSATELIKKFIREELAPTRNK